MPLCDREARRSRPSAIRQERIPDGRSRLDDRLESTEPRQRSPRSRSISSKPDACASARASPLAPTRARAGQSHAALVSDHGPKNPPGRPVTAVACATTRPRRSPTRPTVAIAVAASAPARASENSRTRLRGRRAHTRRREPAKLPRATPVADEKAPPPIPGAPAAAGTVATVATDHPVLDGDRAVSQRGALLRR